MTGAGRHPVLIGVIAALATMVGSWIPSFWNDEAATLRLARLPVTEMVDFVQQKDAVHLLYALLMHVWIGVFGESEFVARAPSAIAVGIAAAGVFVLTQGLGHPRAALFASIVFVALPRTSFNGTEARSYALATALVVWAAVLVVSGARTGRWWRWFLFAVLTGAAISVFLYSVLIIPALLLLAVHARAITRHLLVRLGLAVIVSLVLASPVILTALAQGSQIAWLRSQPVNVYTVLVEPFFAQAWWLTVLVAVLLILAARRGEWTFRHPPITILALVAWIVVPVVVLLLGSALVAPMFTPRYLTVSTPAIAILTGMALTSWRRPLSWALVALVVLAAVPELVSMRTVTGKPGGQDLRGLARTIEREARAGDAFLLSDTGTVSLRPRIALAAYPHAFAGLDDIALEKPYPSTGTYSDLLADRTVLEARLGAVDRVWVALPDTGDPALVDVLEQAGLSPTTVLPATTTTVTLWEAKPSAR